MLEIPSSNKTEQGQLPSKSAEHRQLPPHMQNENADFWLTNDELKEIGKHNAEGMNRRAMILIPIVCVLSVLACQASTVTFSLILGYVTWGILLPLTAGYTAFRYAMANQPFHARRLTGITRRISRYLLPCGPLFAGLCSQVDAIIDANQGKFVDSQVSLAECMLLFGPDVPPKEVSLITVMANMYSRAGRFDLAEPLYEECLERSKGWMVGAFDKAVAQNNIGWVQLLGGKYELAKQSLEEAIRLSEPYRTAHASGRHADFIMCIDLNYARTLIRLDEFNKAESLLNACFNKATKRFKHVETTMAESQLGFAELRYCQNRLDEALMHIESAVHACQSVGGTGNVLHRYARRLQVEILKALGREEEAERIAFECDFEVASVEADNMHRVNEVRALLTRMVTMAKVSY